MSGCSARSGDMSLSWKLWIVDCGLVLPRHERSAPQTICRDDECYTNPKRKRGENVCPRLRFGLVKCSPDQCCEYLSCRGNNTRKRLERNCAFPRCGRISWRI